MRRVRTVVLPISLLVASASVCFPQANTYWVDFEDGSDALAGTFPFAAFRHSPGDPMAQGNAASTVLKPGDTVVFKSGITYHGRIVIKWSGAPNQPITFRSEQPGAPAIIDGSETLSGWERCASAEECGGNSNWQNIHFVQAPAGTGPFSANLFLDETMLWIAQDPNLQDPFYADRYDEYRSVPPAQVTRTTLRDPSYFNQTTPEAWAGAYFAVWAQPNVVYFQQETTFDPANHTISFQALPAPGPYTDRPTRYSVLNHLRVLDRPGEYVFQPVEGGYRIYLWPPASGPISENQVTFSRRDTAFDIGGHRYITIEGLRIQKFSSGARRGAGISAGDAPNTTPKSLVLRDNEIAYSIRNSSAKGAGISLINVEGALIENNRIFENRAMGGIYLLGGTRNAIVRGNAIRRDGYVGIWLMGTADSEVSGNTVEDNRGTHSNGMSVYLNSARVFVFGNRVFNSNMPFTSQASTGVTVAYNVFHNDGFYALADWGGCTSLRILNNVLIRGDDRSAITVASPGAEIHNNLATGPGSAATVDANHNIMARNPALDGLFVNAAGRDYRLRPGASPIDAGRDLGFIADAAGTPVPQESAPDIGAYEFTTDGGGNQPPTVTLSTNGAVFTAPATIVLTADASDPDGSISQVEFFQGSTLLGPATSAPYSFRWNNVPAGPYTLTAKARDNAGATVTSSAVAVTVIATLPGGTRYVRAGATGAGTGADWTNAYPQLPPTLIRGDVYYVADGNYPGYVFDDPASGAQYITIRKATLSDHGTEAGWQASYGDGSAEFPSWDIQASYVSIDGQVGQWAPDLPGFVPYGIRVRLLATGTGAKVIRVGRSGFPKDFIQLRHVEAQFTNTPRRSGSWYRGLDILYGYGDHWTIEYSWLHDAGRVCFLPIGGDHHVIDHSVLERNGHAQVAENYNPSEHSEIMAAHPNSDFGTIRHSHVRDWRSTGGLMLFADCDHWSFHSNVFATTGYWTPGVDLGNANGVMDVLDPGQSAIVVYNNTFVDIAYGGFVFISLDPSKVQVRNNVFDGVTNFPNKPITIGGIRSHNWYRNVTGPQSEPAIELGTSDPFVDRARRDYRLRAPTRSGDATIGATYAIDPAGVRRGDDGVWDRGAFEFKAAGGNQPPTVTLSTNGTVFTAPATIVLTADASDPDGSIRKVEFFGGSTLLGTDSTPPYSFTWSTVPAGSYSLTAKATDSQGASAVSSPVSVTVTGGGGPIPMEGLRLWLKADAGVSASSSSVSRWADQSGAGRDATQGVSASQPTLVANAVNGKPALRFDGINDFLTFSLPVNGLSGVTLVMVSANSQDKSSLLQSRAEYAALFWNETASWGTLYLSPFQTTVASRFGTTQRLNWPLYRRPASIGNSFTTTMAMKDGATDSLWVNGTPVMSEGGKLGTIASCRNIGNLGRGHDDNTYFPGPIAEVLVYARALSAVERAAVERYLRDKYSTW